MRRRRFLLLCGALAAKPAPAGATGALKVRIFDAGRKNLTPARVNVIGSDHAFYEPDPARNPLSEYSLKRKGNRANVGPLRYYGSFFYTDGSFEVRLPPGPARIEVAKGYGYYPFVGEARIAAGKTTNSDIVLERVIDMPRYGWHSTDPHLHFDRAAAASDHTIARLLAAEDVELGHILTAQSAKGFGAGSLYAEGAYAMVSGREVTVPRQGHVNLLMVDQMIPAVRSSAAPPAGMPLATIYDQAVTAHGVMQHDHGGYGQEIYADVVLGKSDWVELLQFGLYRPQVGLEGYYLLLNSGFRYPLAGGSDYGVCKAMSDSRTYVADGPRTSFPAAVGRLLRGESFATSGPLLFLSVDGKGPGSDIEFAGSAPQRLAVRARAVAGDLPFDSLEIVQDGRVVHEWHGSQPVFTREIETTLRVTAGAWIAARCSGPSTVHAHTNPVWVYLDGRAPFQPEAARELAQRIRAFESSGVSVEVQAVARKAAARIEQMLADPPRRMETNPRRFPVGESRAALFPPALARPKPLRPATVEGVVVDSRGQPLRGAAISIRAESALVRTGADGAFRLADVDVNRALFLRVTMPGHATTNTSYLNPRVTAEDLRIVLLSDAEVRAAIGGLARTGPHAILLFSSTATGLDLRMGSAHLARVNGPVQFAGIAGINYQPSDPPQSNEVVPNLIVTVDPLGKDMVLPAFAGQVSWAQISTSRVDLI